MSRPANPSKRTYSSLLPWLILLLLAAATLAAYWPLLHCQFINYDDQDYVTENSMVRSGLTLRGLALAFSTGHTGNWHPLTWLSHMLDCQLFGLNPLAHHATNLFFHTLNSLLLFWILRCMTGALWRSAFVAALFALHPIHVESVAWVSERKDVLSTFFGLLAIWAFLKYLRFAICDLRVAQPPQGRSAGFYLLSVMLFACSLMSKPMLVTLPFVLLLLDYWPLQRFQRKTQDSRLKTLLPLLREKLPFFALALGSCLVTFCVQNKGGAVEKLSVLPLSARCANAAVSYVRYTRKLLWPDDLALPYPLVTWEHWQGLGAFLLLLLLSLLVLWSARRRPHLAVGWLWFVGTLIPVIGLVQVGMQSMADRYAYLPSIGFFMIVSWGSYDLLRRWRAAPLVLSAAGAGVLLGSVWGTRLQLRYWQDSVSLFTRALAVTGDQNLTAHRTLGEALLYQHRFAEAKSHLLLALQLAPRFPGAHYGIGLLLQAEGRPAEAIAHWRTALQLKPGWLPVMNNLAWLLATCRDPACREPTEAVRLAEQVCAGDAWNPSFFDTLAAAYAAAGRFADAAAAARKAITLAEGQGDSGAAARFRARLELYQAGKPYCGP